MSKEDEPWACQRPRCTGGGTKSSNLCSTCKRREADETTCMGILYTGSERNWPSKRGPVFTESHVNAYIELHPGLAVIHLANGLFESYYIKLGTSDMCGWLLEATGTHIRVWTRESHEWIPHPTMVARSVKTKPATVPDGTIHVSFRGPGMMMPAVETEVQVVVTERL